MQQRFIDGEIDIVVATGSSFGTGIDKSNVRAVYLLGLPKSMEVRFLGCYVGIS